jgi:outer membrane lipoprotein carrier protein
MQDAISSSLYGVVIVMLLTVIVFPSFSCASDSLQEVSASERSKILERFSSAHKGMHSIFAAVRQEKQLAALKKKVVVEGTVLMAKPNMLKWDVIKPTRAITVIDGENMTVYHPDIKEAQVYAMSDNLIARNALGFFSTAMSGNLTQMEDKFKVTIFRDDDEIVFKLVPSSKIVGRYIAAVLIHYDQKTALPKGFEMSTPKGDKTVTKLSNIKVNPEIASDTFQLRMPNDVWITNRAEPRSN